MNKARIDALLPLAYEAIHDSGIPEKDGAVQKTFRGQISTFGAAVSMGSLLAAIAFFSNSERALVDRTKLLDAILRVLKKSSTVGVGHQTLYDWAKAEVGLGRENACREAILHAAVSIKLALNLYPLQTR